MIVPMKRVFVLCLEDEREAVLKRLAALGAVQVEREVEDSPAIAAAGAGIAAAETARFHAAGFAHGDYILRNLCLNPATGQLVYSDKSGSGNTLAYWFIDTYVTVVLDRVAFNNAMDVANTLLSSMKARTTAASLQ